MSQPRLVLAGKVQVLAEIARFCRNVYHRTFGPVEGERRYRQLRLTDAVALWRESLSKMRRHHVHMAEETGTAVIVGKRSGTPVVFKVLAGQMHRDGHLFYRSANGVWLAEHVPPAYLEKLP